MEWGEVAGDGVGAADREGERDAGRLVLERGRQRKNEKKCRGRQEDDGPANFYFFVFFCIFPRKNLFFVFLPSVLCFLPFFSSVFCFSIPLLVHLSQPCVFFSSPFTHRANYDL